MSELLERMIKTSYKFLDARKKMLETCKLKTGKVSTYSRFIASYFFSRASEMFESFLVLIQADRRVDSVILLRSLCDMAISFGYILNEDEREKEIRASKYLLAGDKAQKKLLERNIAEFRKQYPDLDPRMDELTTNISKIEEYLTKKYDETDWNLPNIFERAKEVGGIAHNYYNQVYGYYSNVEHHNYIFGQAYVDTEKCEPLEKPEKIEKSTFFRPEIILTMFRGLYLIILNGFNAEFRLKWRDKLDELAKIHDEEYEEIKEEGKEK